MVLVEVAYSPAPRQTEFVSVSVAGTVREALIASGLLERHGLAIEALRCGVWGRRCDLGQALRDGDRVEIYRGLEVDPKEARRLRYKGQRKAKRPAVAGR